ncbi:unnamed protein product [Schistosoma curassoni]|uniref:Uncharacterized protein n=1 Tax=Schistosoma curassoni TaxID=6186 RepID=A0A183L2K0_9TREM|nr:unnamed protein product [Schistosoma curassoni]
MVVGGSRQETLDPGFVLLGTRHSSNQILNLLSDDKLIDNSKSMNSTRSHTRRPSSIESIHPISSKRNIMN